MFCFQSTTGQDFQNTQPEPIICTDEPAKLKKQEKVLSEIETNER